MDAMGDDSTPGKKSSGCMRFTCGGCLTVFAAGFILIAVGLHYLKRWEPGSTAWERLPPSTIWAVEAHNLNAVMDRVALDEGARALLERFNDVIRKLEINFFDDDQDGSSSPSARFIEAYQNISPVFTALFPNIGGIGMGGREGGEIFAFLRPPTWIKLTLWYQSFPKDSVQSLDDGKGNAFHAAYIDGWVIMSPSRELAEEMAANWRSNPRPLGAPVGREDAHVSFAYRDPAALAAAAAAARPSTPGGIMLGGNPFAGATAKKRGAVASARFLLDASMSSWDLSGVMRAAAKPDDGDGGASELEQVFVDSSSLWDAPRTETPKKPDLRLAVRLKRRDYDNALKRLDAWAGDLSPARQAAWKALGWTWLRHVALAGASGDFLLLADKPAVAGRPDGVPPLPVFSLGWTLTPGTDAGQYANDFAAALALWFGALSAPGGNPLEQAVRDAIRYDETDNPASREGVVSLPAVMANAARPAWFIPDRGEPPTAWIASDPAGLPGASAGKAFAGERGVFADDTSTRVALNWDFSEEFLDALHEVAKDRLGLMPETVLPGKEAALKAADLLRDILAAFPRGVLNVNMADDNEEAVIRARF